MFSITLKNYLIEFSQSHNFDLIQIEVPNIFMEIEKNNISNFENLDNIITQEPISLYFIFNQKMINLVIITLINNQINTIEIFNYKFIKDLSITYKDNDIVIYELYEDERLSLDETYQAGNLLFFQIYDLQQRVIEQIKFSNNGETIMTKFDYSTGKQIVIKPSLKKT